ncbi:MAG: hypothetical protein Q4D97_01000 [Eubacteriales bacterium]|nr:hypothetical protein [Eubacteriales bacterium]
MKKRSEYIYPQAKKAWLSRKSLLSLAIVLVFVALVLTLLYFRRARTEQAALTKFDQALQAQNYEGAMELYYRVQGQATNQELDSKDRIPAQSMQVEMEAKVADLVSSSLQNLEAGHSLSPEERTRIEDLRFLSAMQVIPFLRTKTEALLDGRLEPGHWENMLQAFADLDNVKTYTQELLGQKNSLLAKIEKFEQAGLLEQGDKWQLTWAAWDELAQDLEGSAFAREYASFRLSAFQEREYAHLMTLTGQMMEAEQYYTAYNLLTLMYEVFPEREELAERLEVSRKLIPPLVDTWQGEVLVLSLRPLIVRPELAFNRSTEAGYAHSSLITGQEFLRLLEILYRNDYVLISSRQFASWPQRRVELKVPGGKKPLLLIFDRWQYSVLNQVAGTAAKLTVEEDGQLLAQAGLSKGRDLDAIPLLEDFIAKHPDFAFDGAKALLALNLEENLLGYAVSQDQVAASKEAWDQVGQVYPELTDEEILGQREAASRVMTYLQEHGWSFASAGYVGYDTGRLALADLGQELDQWSQLMSSWLADTPYFVFPNGSHVYSLEEHLDLLLDRGYNIFFGQGPKPYLFYTRSFAHLDALPLNGYSLASSEAYLANLLAGQDILDHDLREGE